MNDTKKNIKLFAPVSSGRTWLSRKILKAHGDKIGYIEIIDELLVSDHCDYVVNPELREKFIYICLGFTSVPDDALRPKQKAEELLDASKKWKEFAHKRNLQYFDVTKRDEETYDTIVEWVKNNLG